MKNPQLYEIVYFSGSRIARYTGKADEKLVKLVRACGYEVNSIEVDEFSGTVKVTQKGEEE